MTLLGIGFSEIITMFFFIFIFFVETLSNKVIKEMVTDNSHHLPNDPAGCWVECNILHISRVVFIHNEYTIPLAMNQVSREEDFDRHDVWHYVISQLMINFQDYLY